MALRSFRKWHASFQDAGLQNGMGVTQGLSNDMSSAGVSDVWLGIAGTGPGQLGAAVAEKIRFWSLGSPHLSRLVTRVLLQTSSNDQRARIFEAIVIPGALRQVSRPCVITPY
jgi:hypothetical protein